MTRPLSQLLTVVFVFAVVLADVEVRADPQVKPSALGSSKAVMETRKAGWLALSQVVPVLERGDSKQFPGIAAWLEDYRQATSGIDPQSEPDSWPAVDVDALVANNANYWRAHYEIAPGDPAIILVHSGLLLLGCEPQRAANVLVIGLQRPGIPAPVRHIMERLAEQAGHSLKESNAAIQEGIKLYDQRKYAEALKQHETALVLCPQNGFAHYEWGLTQRQIEWTAAGVDPNLKQGSILINGGPKSSKEVAAAFARARRHDPFQWRAYQGEDKETIEGLMVLMKKGMPNWEKLSKMHPKLVDDQVIANLSEGTQGAQIDELALLVRQIVVARRGGFAQEDHPFIASSLRRLAAGETTEQVLERLGGKNISLRQLIAPEK